MKINITKYEEQNLIMIETFCDNVEDIKLVKIFYSKVLSSTLINRDIKLITIQPRKYSLGYEQTSKRQIKINKTDILVNEISDCDAELIENINESEEFERGLLAIVLNENLFEELIIEILNFQKDNNKLITKGMVIFCENDGNTLLLFNSNSLVEELESLLVDLKTPLIGPHFGASI